MNKKLYSQIFSYFATTLIYVLIFNWRAALVIVGAIAFHESGHLWAAKKLKLKTGGFYLIPFFGGIALITDEYKNYYYRAIISIMGPVWGLFQGMICFILFFITKNNFFLQATSLILIINLINLAPLSFLDGGQLLQSIVASFENKIIILIINIISYLLGVCLMGFFNPFIAGVMLLFAISSIFHEALNFYYFKKQKFWLVSKQYLEPPLSMTSKEIFIIISMWLWTIILLLVLLYIASQLPNNSINLLFHK